jgi:hypothetical protein
MGKELTEAERAAANALARHHNMVHGDGIVRLAPDDFADDARAVVVAVAPIVKRETLDRFGDRMGTISHSRPACPDLFCMGWKDSGICHNEPMYRHNP